MPNSHDQLRSLLLKAFDEGAESPYDLRENIVNSLIGEVIEHSKEEDDRFVELKGFYRMSVVSNLPEVITKALLTSNAWLCGGAVLNCMINANLKTWTENSDWDLFCNEEDFGKLSHFCNVQINSPRPSSVMPRPGWHDDNAWGDGRDDDFMSELQNVINVTDDDYNFAEGLEVWSGVMRGLDQTVQVIKGNFATFGDIVRNFDLALVQVGIRHQKDSGFQLVATKEAWDDMTQGIIHFAKNFNYQSCKARQRDKTKKRIIKYIRRGFRDGTRIVETGILPLIHNFKAKLSNKLEEQNDQVN